MGCYCTLINNTSSSIGSGLTNTKEWENSGCVTIAKGYTYGGFSDWFIPSKDELNEIYLNLKFKNIGSLKDVQYWSSTPAAYGSCSVNGGVAVQNFGTGKQLSEYRNGYQGSGNLRLIRGFISDEDASTYLWSTGETSKSISPVINKFTDFWVDITTNGVTCRKYISIETYPSVNVTLNGLNPFTLRNSSSIQLVGSPKGGSYSGAAVSNDIFTPANATLGKKTISYNYTSQKGCRGSASQTTIIVDSIGNVCSTYDTLKIKVNFTAGLYANTTNTIKFYPNPTNDILNIDNGNYQAMNGYSIKIVSLTGASVYYEPITSQLVQISMNQFATRGLYIAQILDSNNSIVDSKKIVLE
jgi:hypothetical protein